MNEHVVEAVAVVVPVNDEEALLPRCLTALSVAVRALRATHPQVAVEVVVVLDACTDGSSTVAARHDVRVITTDDQCVGTARSAGAGYAASLLGVDESLRASRAWLANTDADSVVPPGWLTHQVASALSGADLVIGRVRPDPADSTEQLRRAWGREHRSADPLRHVHGANLGVRWDAFNAVGGFAHVPEHEDVLLVEALLATSARVARGPEVLTSARRHGRTPGGFSGYLRDLSADRGPSDLDLCP